MDQLREQVPWSEQQWEEINQIVNEELEKTRIVDKFIPRSSTVIANNELTVPANVLDSTKPSVNDRDRIELVEVWTTFELNKNQVNDPSLENAISLFRRSANNAARVEDAILLRGQASASKLPNGINLKFSPEIIGGGENSGLSVDTNVISKTVKQGNVYGETAVSAIYESVGVLKSFGYGSPYALISGLNLYQELHTPTNSMVMPIDRVSPLIDNQFWMTDLLNQDEGLVISLSGDPVDIVLALPPTAMVYNVASQSCYIFGIYEKFALRLKEKEAIVKIKILLK